MGSGILPPENGLQEPSDEEAASTRIYVQTYHQCHLWMSRAAYGMGQEEQQSTQDPSIGVGWIHYERVPSCRISDCKRMWRLSGFHRYRWDNIAKALYYAARFQGAWRMGTR